MKRFLTAATAAACLLYIPTVTYAAAGHDWLAGRVTMQTEGSTISTAPTPTATVNDPGDPGWGDGFTALASQREDYCTCPGTGPWTTVGNQWHDLVGGDPRGKVVQQYGPGFNTDTIQRVGGSYRPGYGQGALIGGVHSKDRTGMDVTFGGALGDGFGVDSGRLVIDDARDQLPAPGENAINKNPRMTVSWFGGDGNLLRRDVYKGLTTKQGNGNRIVTKIDADDYGKDGWDQLKAKVRVGYGKVYGSTSTTQAKATTQKASKKGKSGKNGKGRK